MNFILALVTIFLSLTNAYLKNINLVKSKSPLSRNLCLFGLDLKTMEVDIQSDLNQYSNLVTAQYAQVTILKWSIVKVENDKAVIEIVVMEEEKEVRRISESREATGEPAVDPSKSMAFDPDSEWMNDYRYEDDG